MKFSLNRTWTVGLILAAVVLTGLVSVVVAAWNSGESAPLDASSQGALVVQTGRDDDIKLDPKRPMRCFVGGQMIGEVLLADCAKRNGVAPGAMDVGLDPSGALAAGHGAGPPIAPIKTPDPVGLDMAVDDPPGAQTPPDPAPDSPAPQSPQER